MNDKLLDKGINLRAEMLDAKEELEYAKSIVTAIKNAVGNEADVVIKIETIGMVNLEAHEIMKIFMDKELLAKEKLEGLKYDFEKL